MTEEHFWSPISMSKFLLFKVTISVVKFQRSRLLSQTPTHLNKEKQPGKSWNHLKFPLSSWKTKSRTPIWGHKKCVQNYHNCWTVQLYPQALKGLLFLSGPLTLFFLPSPTKVSLSSFLFYNFMLTEKYSSFSISSNPCYEDYSLIARITLNRKFKVFLGGGVVHDDRSVILTNVVSNWPGDQTFNKKFSTLLLTEDFLVTEYLLVMYMLKQITLFFLITLLQNNTQKPVSKRSLEKTKTYIQKTRNCAKSNYYDSICVQCNRS